jgi:predicted permease
LLRGFTQPTGRAFRSRLWLVWSAYCGVTALTWLATLALAARVLRVTPTFAVIAATSAVYGNIAMLGIPLALAAFGLKVAGPMALILAVNTPLLWLCATLQIAWVERKENASISGRRTPAARSPAQAAYLRNRGGFSVAAHQCQVPSHL